MPTTITEPVDFVVRVALAVGNFVEHRAEEVSDQGAAKLKYSIRAPGFLCLSFWLGFAAMAWSATPPPSPSPAGLVATSSPAGTARYPLAPEALGLMLQVLDKLEDHVEDKDLVSI